MYYLDINKTNTVEYSEEAGLYDSVMTYDADDDYDIGVEVGADVDSKTVVVNLILALEAEQQIGGRSG